MNKIFKTAILLLFLIVNFGFSEEKIINSGITLEHIRRGLHSFDDIKPSQTPDNFFKKANTFNFIKALCNLFYYKQEFCSAKVKELIAQVQGIVIKELKEMLPKDLKAALESVLNKSSTLKPSALEELEGKVRKALIMKLTNHSDKNPIESNLSQGELKKLEKLAMNAIDELILVHAKKVLELDENSNLKEELGEKISILIPRAVLKTSFVKISRSGSYDEMFKPDMNVLLRDLIAGNPSSDSIDELKKSSAEWKEKMHSMQYVFERILKENKFDLNAEFYYSLHSDRHPGIVTSYSGYLISSIFRRFCSDYSFTKDMKHFSISFPDTSIFDKMLKNNKVIIRSGGIKEILKGFFPVFYNHYYSAPFQIRGSKEEGGFLPYRQKYIKKLLGYIEVFIDNSPSLNIKLPDFFYDNKYYKKRGMSQGIPEIIKKLEKRIQDKREKFFADFASCIEHNDISGVKELLNSLNNEDADSFYDENKVNVDNRLSSKFIPQIFRNAGILAETISYLNHNKLEIAIRNALQTRLEAVEVVPEVLESILDNALAGK